MYKEMKENEIKTIVSTIKFVGVLIFFAIIFWILLMPWVSIYTESMHGKAELARAEGNRQIAIKEAEAKKEASVALAEAEIIRAEGVAKANKIIGDSLSQNEAYLRYLWIQGLQTNQMQVVYVPTEANLPILETNRLNLHQ